MIMTILIITNVCMVGSGGRERKGSVHNRLCVIPSYIRKVSLGVFYWLKNAPNEKMTETFLMQNYSRNNFYIKLFFVLKQFSIYSTAQGSFISIEK